ncbi:DUF1212-domain-containing protein [Poronia punctata]|nr:DUF1212-domain-containing protein [Poronia punctata]
MEGGQEPPPDDSRPSTGGSSQEVQSPTVSEFGNMTKKEKGRVRFNSTASVQPPPTSVRELPSEEPRNSNSYLRPMPRPSLLRANSYNSVVSLADGDEEDQDPESEEAISARRAQERARHIAATVLGSHSAPGSRRSSFDSQAESTIYDGGHGLLTDGDIHLDDLDRTGSELHRDENKLLRAVSSQQQRELKREAYDLVRSHTQHRGSLPFENSTPNMPAESSGRATPVEDRPEHYVPRPEQYRGSILSNLLRLYNQPGESQPPSYPGSVKSAFSEFTTPGNSGTATPTTRRKWYEKDKNRSTDTLTNLVEASARLADISGGLPQSPKMDTTRPKRPKRPRHKNSSNNRLFKFARPRMEEEIRITINIAETLSRQRYIIKMCKALMMFGAPTHRLEEYLTMTARVLEIEGQFLYLPGCMIISFDDRQTHTTEVKIVRTNQGIDLGRLKDIHEIYKSVLHDLYSVDEAMEKISAIMDAKDKFHPWLRVLFFGLASATVAPFAFGGRWIDLPVCFFLGSIVGALQIIVSPKSALYNNIFEISATVLTSFLSRAFGSIRGGNLFCFSALAQSSIALILPGWFVLSAALELQSRSLVPGSIRLVYAIIYSLFLGFGITVGTVLYGIFDENATSATTCSNTMDSHLAFMFVPMFTICLAIVNQAKWKQLPIMVLISFAGYVVNFFSSPKLTAAPQIANTVGAFTVGVLANLYSRLRHGVAVVVLLPAIFVQVPSGLAATGSLLSGLNAANQINNNTQPVAGTPSVPYQNGNTSDLVYNVAGSMIQIAIGITLGLFLSALVVYPFGKRRSGLWTL